MPGHIPITEVMEVKTAKGTWTFEDLPSYQKKSKNSSHDQKQSILETTRLAGKGSLSIYQSNDSNERKASGSKENAAATWIQSLNPGVNRESRGPERSDTIGDETSRGAKEPRPKLDPNEGLYQLLTKAGHPKDRNIRGTPYAEQRVQIMRKNPFLEPTEPVGNAENLAKAAAVNNSALLQAKKDTKLTAENSKKHLTVGDDRSTKGQCEEVLESDDEEIQGKKHCPKFKMMERSFLVEHFQTYSHRPQRQIDTLPRSMASPVSSTHSRSRIFNRGPETSSASPTHITPSSARITSTPIIPTRFTPSRIPTRVTTPRTPTAMADPNIAPANAGTKSSQKTPKQQLLTPTITEEMQAKSHSPLHQLTASDVHPAFRDDPFSVRSLELEDPFKVHFGHQDDQMIAANGESCSKDAVDHSQQIGKIDSASSPDKLSAALAAMGLDTGTLSGDHESPALHNYDSKENVVQDPGFEHAGETVTGPKPAVLDKISGNTKASNKKKNKNKKRKNKSDGMTPSEMKVPLNSIGSSSSKDGHKSTQAEVLTNRSGTSVTVASGNGELTLGMPTAPAGFITYTGALGEEGRNEEVRSAAFVAYKESYLRRVSQSIRVYRDPADTNAPPHPNHGRVWASKNLWCAVCQGRCAVCNAPCCSLSETLILSTEESIPAEARSVMLDLNGQIRRYKQTGTDEGTFMDCTECGKLVCPNCAGLCPIFPCHDRICKACKPDPWAPCDWHGAA